MLPRPLNSIILRALLPFLLAAAALPLPGLLATASSSPSSPAEDSRPKEKNILQPVLDLVGQIGNQPPPPLLWTPDPSPECANAGEATCCQGAVAGDLPLVVFLAGVYGYELNENDVVGVYCTFYFSIFLLSFFLLTNKTKHKNNKRKEKLSTWGWVEGGNEWMDEQKKTFSFALCQFLLCLR